MLNKDQLRELIDEPAFGTIWSILGNPTCEILEVKHIGSPPFRGGSTKTTYTTIKEVPCLSTTEKRYPTSQPGDPIIETVVYLRRSDLSGMEIEPSVHKIRLQGKVLRIKAIEDIIGVLYKIYVD